MNRSVNRNVKQRKIHMIILIVLILLCTILGGGYYLLKQTKENSEKTNRQKQSAQTSADSAQDSNTVEYKGETYKYNDHLSNYLFMGIDTRDAVDTYQTQEDAGQADAIFLVSLDRAEEKMKVLFIPRDTMTKIAVSNLLDGLPIQGYCAMNIDGISAITDYVGGVEITVPDNSLEEVNPDFKEGAVVTLTGENAEQFVRYRDTGKSQSALVRQERQKTYLQAFLQKAQQEASKDAGFITGLYESIQEYTVTNMGNDIFARLLTASQNGIADSQTVPGEGTQGQNFDEYHVDEEKLKDMIISMFYDKN